MWNLLCTRLLVMMCMLNNLLMQGSSAELPKNGPFWHEIREVALPDVAHVTTEFNSLLKVSDTDC